MEDFEVKARPSAAIHVVMIGRQLVLDSYPDIVAKLDDASPGDRIEFCGYTDFFDVRVIRRICVVAEAVISVEEITDTWNEAMEEHREQRAKGTSLDEVLDAFRFGGS